MDSIITSKEITATITPYLPTQDLDKAITKALLSVGVLPNIRGFTFLKDAIAIIVMEPEMQYNLYKGLFPVIAQLHNVSLRCVIHRVRYAIDMVYDRGRIEQINALFGVDIFNKNDKPAPKEFIALLSEYIRQSALTR